MRNVITAFVLSLITPPHLRSENAVHPGRVTVEPPTLICLGFEWDISGDDNRSALVEVAYRQSAASEWKEALPLLRLGGERVFRFGRSNATEYLDDTVTYTF